MPRGVLDRGEDNSHKEGSISPARSRGGAPAIQQVTAGARVARPARLQRLSAHAATPEARVPQDAGPCRLRVQSPVSASLFDVHLVKRLSDLGGELVRVTGLDLVREVKLRCLVCVLVVETANVPAL